MAASERTSRNTCVLATDEAGPSANRWTRRTAAEVGRRDLDIRRVPSLLVFQVLCQVRKNARSPSNATLTGVTTGVPSRRNVANAIVFVCRSGSSEPAAPVSE